MNREEFFKNLERELSRLSEEDRVSAIEFYNEYFDEAGEENEQAVIKELGTPSQLATRIKADIAVKELDKAGEHSVKKGISAIWLVILAIFAAPIALPIAIAAAALSIGIFAVIIALVFALFISVAAFFLSGIVILVSGIAVFATSIPTALFTIGIGIFIVGITIIVGILVALAARGILSFAAKMINRGVNKKVKGEARNE